MKTFACIAFAISFSVRQLNAKWQLYQPFQNKIYILSEVNRGALKL
jgi:hypothetical protein